MGRIAVLCAYMRPVVVDGVAAGLSVCHNFESCKNGWTNWDAVWDVDLGGFKEACIRWGCTLTPLCEYDWTAHVWLRCGISAHLFCYWMCSHICVYTHTQRERERDYIVGIRIYLRCCSLHLFNSVLLFFIVFFVQPAHFCACDTLLAGSHNGMFWGLLQTCFFGADTLFHLRCIVYIADRIPQHIQGWCERWDNEYWRVPSIRSIHNASHRLRPVSAACHLLWSCHCRSVASGIACLHIAQQQPFTTTTAIV